VENVITNDSHSTYHALQTSLAGSVGHGGPGIQASYTWSKSIDTTSEVLGGTGSTGAVASGFSQNPYDTHPEKGPSAFDVTNSFGLSLAQDLHLESAQFLRPVSRKVTYGWELLSISSISSGAPFTVFSGIQQTGAGDAGVDRPDQIAQPHLSTARSNRQDYFGEGANNAADFFSIPIHMTAAPGPTRASLARWAAIASVAPLTMTTISRSSRTRLSAAARAEPNARICSSAQNSSTCSTL